MPNKKNLKILLVTPDFNSGIGAMARHLAKSVRGVDYYFFVDAHFKMSKDEFLKLVNHVDIIHWLSNLSWVKFPPGIDIQELPIPSIATVHHVDEKLTGFGEVEEETKLSEASKAEIIHTVAKEWQNYLEKKTDKPVFLSHHAINPKQFKANQRIKRPHQPFRIGTFNFAKSIDDRKRMDVLLGALLILKKKDYEIELFVQGRHWDTLQKIFMNKGINVINLGFVNSHQAMRNYRHIDLYVCSSDVEGGPLPVLEALASGVPVVSTKVGVATEALSIGGGILVNKGQPEVLASAIAQLIDDPMKYHELKQQTVRTAQFFSWDNVENEYLRMYQYVLDHHPKSPSKGKIVIPAKFQRHIQLFRYSQFGSLYSSFLRSVKQRIKKVITNCISHF